MGRDRKERKAGSSGAAPRSGSWRRWIIFGTGGVCLLLLVFLWGPLVASWGNMVARGRLAVHRPEQAVPWLTWSAGWNPNDPETHFLLARAYRKLGESEKFVAQLKQAGVLGMETDRLQREQWLAMAQAGQMSEVEPYLSELLTNPQGDAIEISEAFSNGYMLNGRFQKAFQILDAWSLDYPKAAQPHYMRGLVWQHLGSFESAETSFRRSLDLQSDHYPACLALGKLLVERKQVKEAVEFFERARAGSATRQEGQLGLAQCFRLLGDNARSRELLEALLEEDPQYVGAASELGQLELGQNHFDEALRWLRKAVESLPKDPELRYAFAQALSAAKKGDEAQPHYDYVREAQQGLGRARDLMVQANNDPHDAAIRAEIGKILLQYGPDREGLVWLGSALDIEPHCTAAHESLADYYERKQVENPRLAPLAAQHRRLSKQKRAAP